MKVKFAHVVIIQLATDAGFRHIAIFEDDITLVGRNMSLTVRDNFQTLISSKNNWSFVRLGFRPYFLQKNADAHCPTKCRCQITHYGDHLCRLKASGCDIRSSDLYVVNSLYFKKFQQRLTDLRMKNAKRIVDLHPLRSFSHQWLLIPQISYQRISDLPPDYQLGAGALFITKCVQPRPLPARLAMSSILVQQTSDS